MSASRVRCYPTTSPAPKIASFFLPQIFCAAVGSFRRRGSTSTREGLRHLHALRSKVLEALRKLRQKEEDAEAERLKELKEDLRSGKMLITKVG